MTYEENLDWGSPGFGKPIVVKATKVTKQPGFCEHCGLELPLTGECGWC